MKRVPVLALLAALILASAIAPVNTIAEETPQQATVVLEKTKEVLMPSQPTLRKVTITINAGGDSMRTLTGAQALKKSPEGRQMLFVILEPADMKGTAYLMREQKSNENKMHLYVPSMRRVREIESEQQYDRFLGTDYTYFDLGFLRHSSDYVLQGEEDYAGTRAYKLEEKIALPRSFYSRIILWVAKESQLPLERHYYDQANRLWKVERFDEVAMVSGVPTPMKITMKDIQKDTSTVLQLREVQYCGELDEALFNPQNLPEAAAFPIWEPFCSLPTKAPGQ